MAISHNDCIKNLEGSQGTEYDNREKIREADAFLNARDGQWEPGVAHQFLNKPRLTMDECNPIVDDIMGEIETAEFGAKVFPDGYGATKDLAEAYEGIIRSIENFSTARFIYNAAARVMIGTGFDAWRVMAGYRNDSFDQDLMIKGVDNAVDSLWYDAGASKQDMSDSNECWLLKSLTKDEYDRQYKDGAGVSVGTDRASVTNINKKPDEIIVGEYFEKKKEQKELVLMSDNSIYEVDDDFKKVKDDLANAGVTVKKTRKHGIYVVYHRVFDGADWLKPRVKTVFSYIPIVPVFGNFTISDNGLVYWGAIEKLMDAQRVINYSESRKLEEGALAPKDKVWMGKKHAMSADVQATLQTLNTNNDPVQFFDDTGDGTQPFFMQGSSVKQGLIETSQTMQNFIQRTSGSFDEAGQRNLTQRGAEAIGLLHDKSDNPKRKWFSAMEIGLTHTARIIVEATPKVYDTPRREIQILNEDETSEPFVINEPVVDEKTGKVVSLNDLSKGKYGVYVSAGAAFSSRQQEAVRAINEIGKVDPTIFEMGADVLLKNIPAPSIDKIAERKRLQMVKAGVIPENQLTDEEKELVAQAQQAQGNTPDAMMVAAQAEMEKANAAHQKNQIEAQKNQLAEMSLKIKAQSEAFKAEQNGRAQTLKELEALNNQVKTQAETLETLKNIIGANQVISPQLIKAFENQVAELNESIMQQ